MKKPFFKIGDKVTYKSISELPNQKYWFDGRDQKGFIGEVLEVYEFYESRDCFKLRVTTDGCGAYTMLESEFVEYDKQSNLSIPINTESKKPKLSVYF